MNELEPSVIELEAKFANMPGDVSSSAASTRVVILVPLRLNCATADKEPRWLLARVCAATRTRDPTRAELLVCFRLARSSDESACVN